MKRLLLLAVVASALFLIPTSASAAVNCSLAGGVLTVNVTGTGDQTAGLRMISGGSEIGVFTDTTFSTAAPACAGGPPTPLNTASVTVADAEAGAQRTIVAISQAGGPFNNVASESPGIAEIEISVNGGDESTDNLSLSGGPGPAGDNWRMGQFGGGDGYQLDDTENAGASDVDDLTTVGVEELQIGIHGNPGDDIIDARGGTGFSGALDSNFAVSQIVAGTGDDQIFAGDGDGWRLEGDVGADTHVGGPGNDFMQLSFGADADTADGNGGTDACSWLNHNDPVTVDLRVTAPQNTGGAGIDTLSDCETLTGGNGGDTLIATSGPNSIFSGPGNDTLIGLGGDDTLDGGADLDTLSYEQGSTGPVTVDIGNAAAQNTGGAGTDTISTVESLTGSEFSDTLTGDAAPNVIDGHDGLLDVIDCAGNTDGAIVDEIGVDTVSNCEAVDNAPKVSVGVPPADGALLADATPAYPLTADEGATFQVSVDGGAFNACAASCEPAALSDGAHTLRFRAVDTDENLNPGLNFVSRTLTVDTTAPAVQIDDGPSGDTEDTTPTFAFSAAEAATFECRVDAGPFAACSGPGAAHTPDALALGAHTFEVRAADAAGNSATATRTFAVVAPAVTPPPVDSIAPQTTITKVKVKGDGAKIKFTSNETASTFSCKLDRSPFRPCKSPAKFKNLDEGKHKIKVIATDAAGNKDATAAKAKFRVE